VKKNHVKIGVISVPAAEAQEVFRKMILADIRGFLNFSPVELKCTKAATGLPECPSNCTVYNMNISPALENLYYLVNMKEKMETS
jgi:redox-sensing transcriptional repressor